MIWFDTHGKRVMYFPTHSTTHPRSFVVGPGDIMIVTGETCERF
jgi:hypothetical protein